MKIFISWSLERSHLVALELRKWLPAVIQQVRPFVSSEDVVKGTAWLTTLMDELDTTSEGVVCLTSDNQAQPWLNYEAGALSKTTGHKRVRTVLLDLEPSQVEGPLSAFQHTRLFEHDDMWKFVKSILGQLSEPLDEPIALRAFEREWSDLQDALCLIRDAVPASPAAATRPPEDMIRETLDLVRALTRQVAASPSEVAVAREQPTLDFGPDPEQLQHVNKLRATIRIGSRVIHDTFGVGTVAAVAGEGMKSEATIDFESVGKKRLLLAYAPMKLLPSG